MKLIHPRSYRSGSARQQSGAVLVESVVMLVALTFTMASVLTLLSLGIKQAACEKIFSGADESGFAFNPHPENAWFWRPGPSSQRGCYVLSGGDVTKVF